MEFDDKTDNNGSQNNSYSKNNHELLLKLESFPKYYSRKAQNEETNRTPNANGGNHTGSVSDRVSLKKKRFDLSGNLILKEKKAHKITFADEIGKSLKQESCVKSFKEYNRMEIQYKKEDYCQDMCLIQ